MSTLTLSSEQVQVSIPARDDGTAWPYVLNRGDRTVFADTATDLVAALIPGYADIPATSGGADDALVARYENAVATANDTQPLVAASCVDAGTFDTSTAGEALLSALFSDRSQPLEGIEDWGEPVPLVLVSTDYSPFVEDRTPPSGNVLWLDPSDEMSHLRSLANLGLVELLIQLGN